MEGILELREVAAAIRRATGSPTTSCSKSRASKSSKRPSNGIDHIAFYGFTRGALDDLLVICDEYGIEPRTEVDAGRTSAVVVPFDSADLSRHATLLSPGLLKRAARAGVPVVTLDFLFEVVDALKRVRDVCGRGCRAYAVAGAEEASVESVLSRGLPEPKLTQLSASEVGVEMTQEALGDMAEAYSVGVGSLKVFGNEFYGAPSGDGDGDECSFTRVVEEVEQDENVDGNRGWVEANGKGDHDDEADEVRACTPSSEHTDPGACDVDDLETFAAISSVTPLEMGKGQDIYDVGGGWEGSDDDNGDDNDDDKEESEVAAMRALVLDDEGSRAPSTADARRANGVLGADDIFPGVLLVRAPRNGKVRQRHVVPVGRQNVLYTDSMTLRPRGRDMVEIDIKAAKNVAIQCHDRRIIIKPAFFYKLRGEGWRCEFRRFLAASDLPAELGLPKDLDRAELFLSTAVEGCSVQSLANVEKVFVDKLAAGGSTTRNAAVLGMETVGDGTPAWFYRHEYDVQSGHVLYKTTMK